MFCNLYLYSDCGVPPSISKGALPCFLPESRSIQDTLCAILLLSILDTSCVLIYGLQNQYQYNTGGFQYFRQIHCSFRSSHLRWVGKMFSQLSYLYIPSMSPCQLIFHSKRNSYYNFRFFFICCINFQINRFTN